MCGGDGGTALSGGGQFGSVGGVTVPVPPVMCLVGILVGVRRYGEVCTLPYQLLAAGDE